ncbi:MAG: hypothetical protein ISS29_00675 [Candidatus Marinimicrobia bacterium]|nr:hypothetical protein [Candidatus Neomarinimicrobiota bacterium]
MAGNLEKRHRTTLWEMLRDLPNLAKVNGSSHWHVFPNHQKRRLRIKQNTNHPVIVNTRGPPVIEASFRRFGTFGRFKAT